MGSFYDLWCLFFIGGDMTPEMLQKLWQSIQESGKYDEQNWMGLMDLAPEAYGAMGQEYMPGETDMDLDMVLEYLQAQQPPMGMEEQAPPAAGFDINQYIEGYQANRMNPQAKPPRPRQNLAQQATRAASLPWKKNPGGATAITR
jgi:hypothetical protein